MLEKPQLDEVSLIAALRDAFGLDVVAVSFLPLGADADSAVYRVETVDDVRGNGGVYFAKLRRGDFNANIVRLPFFLAAHGVNHLIAPMMSVDRCLWTTFGAYVVTLYPFVAGRDGYDAKMSPGQWAQLGAALRGMHALALPDDVRASLPVWRDAAQWRTRMAALLHAATTPHWHDSLATEAAAMLREQRATITHLIRLAEAHAVATSNRAWEMVACHADIHAGNVLLAPDGSLFVVDWDTLVLAPKERDLMFIGGGLMGDWVDPAEEERLFYAGYGATDVDAGLLAYFRAMRILEDLVLYAEELLHSAGSGEDRALALHYLKSNFRPGATIALVDRVPRVPPHPGRNRETETRP